MQLNYEIWSFVALLRFDDLIRIRRSNLIFSSEYLKIQVTQSKNDQLREGNAVLVSETDTPLSTVKLVKQYLRTMQIPDDCNKHIFRPMVKGKGATHSLVKDDKHISYTTFRESLKSHLSAIVEDTSIYSTHSLRAGGATKAANSGVNERCLQRHGRWKSISSKNMYIKDSVSHNLEVSKIIQE